MMVIKTGPLPVAENILTKDIRSVPNYGITILIKLFFPFLQKKEIELKIQTFFLYSYQLKK